MGLPAIVTTDQGSEFHNFKLDYNYYNNISGGPYFAAEVFGPHMRSRGPNTSGGVQIFHA